MFLIEITLDIQNEATGKAEALMTGVVQLPCVPFNGMQIKAPDGSGAESELTDVAYCLQRKMFVGMLSDTCVDSDDPAAKIDHAASVVESWKQVGFTCAWGNEDDDE